MSELPRALLAHPLDWPNDAVEQATAMLAEAFVDQAEVHAARAAWQNHSSTCADDAVWHMWAPYVTEQYQCLVVPGEGTVASVLHGTAQLLLASWQADMPTFLWSDEGLLPMSGELHLVGRDEQGRTVYAAPAFVGEEE